MKSKSVQIPRVRIKVLWRSIRRHLPRRSGNESHESDFWSLGRKLHSAWHADDLRANRHGGRRSRTDSGRGRFPDGQRERQSNANFLSHSAARKDLKLAHGPTNDWFTGDGTTTSFALSSTPAGEVQCFWNGLLENPSGYIVNGQIVTLSETPAEGDSVAFVYSTNPSPGGGAWPGNYVQPNTGAPTANPSVGVAAMNPVTGNPLQIIGPRTQYNQPGTDQSALRGAPGQLPVPAGVTPPSRCWIV
jgi:hypothetical protein